MNEEQLPFIWIEDIAEFSRLANIWKSGDFLAIDTEFERRTTYFQILALVQIYDGKQIYLIDPLKVECPEAFREICCDPNIIKILHSAKEDLEVLFYSWQCQIKGLFDTQVANAFLTQEMSLGYAALVEQNCKVKLDKQETQSDWLARPLTPLQLNYAAADVFYLPKIYTQLVQELKQKPYENIFHQECDEFCELTIKVADPSESYRKAKDVWRLSQKDLSLFKVLYEWRQNTAIDENKVPNHIIKEAELVQLTLNKPSKKSDFYKIDGIHPRSIKRYWQIICEIIQSYDATAQERLAVVLNPRDIPQFKALNKKLILIVQHEAKKLEINPLLLSSKRLIKKIAFAELANEEFPDAWHGWRGRILKSSFETVFTEVKADKC